MKTIDILKKYVEVISHKRNEPIYEFTKKILDNYLLDVENAEEDCFPDKGSKETCIKAIEEINTTILDCIDKYNHAQIGESIADMKQLIDSYCDNLVAEIPKDYIWYRMRKTDFHHRTYPADEMFHLPFNLRGKVGNQRYSISGYPCLYLGVTSYACWAEMREPALADVCVTVLKGLKDFKVLDLRLPTEPILKSIEGKNNKIMEWLYKLPLFLACSVKVSNDDDVFKEEYIIPQILMLSIAKHESVIGCYYISTRRNKNFVWDSSYLANLALPVKCVEENGFCSKLKELFEIKDSICYEYELTKDSFRGLEYGELIQDTDGNTVKKDDYIYSLWAKLDRVLRHKGNYIKLSN